MDIGKESTRLRKQLDKLENELKRTIAMYEKNGAMDNEEVSNTTTVQTYNVTYK